MQQSKRMLSRSNIQAHAVTLSECGQRAHELGPLDVRGEARAHRHAIESAVRPFESTLSRMALCASSASAAAALSLRHATIRGV